MLVSFGSTMSSRQGKLGDTVGATGSSSHRMDLPVGIFKFYLENLRPFNNYCQEVYSVSQYYSSNGSS